MYILNIVLPHLWFPQYRPTTIANSYLFTACWGETSQFFFLGSSAYACSFVGYGSWSMTFHLFKCSLETWHRPELETGVTSYFGRPPSLQKAQLFSMRRFSLCACVCHTYNIGCFCPAIWKRGDPSIHQYMGAIPSVFSRSEIVGSQSSHGPLFNLRCYSIFTFLRRWSIYRSI